MTSDPTAPPTATTVAWKPDWPQAQRRIVDWWRGAGLLLNVSAPLDKPRLDLERPARPDDLRRRWLNPQYRAHLALYNAARTFFGGEHVPYAGGLVGAGDLAAFLGCEYDFAESTCWFEPCIQDLASHPPLAFDPDNANYRAVYDMLAECQRVADGRYLIGLPDLVENYDILAAMRGSEALLIDSIDDADEVERRIDQINHAYFEVYDRFYDLLKAPDGSVVFDAFGLWGPGRTAKVQCDAAAMISPDMFQRFVTPALTEQCRWLDCSMYHLDGTQAMVHVDELLSIDPLNAIEWTPQAGIPQGGDPRWYDLYRRIKAGGKAVQAIGVQPDEVEPLLDAVGPGGMSVCVRAESEAQARELIDRVEPYRQM